MIFKPKVKQNASKILARFPLFLLLALVCLIGHPARAEAADDVLNRNMREFTRIGDYDIIQTKGEILKEMFNLRTSSIKDSKQYIAYFKIDKKATSGHTWSTYYSYWHTKAWTDCCVPKIENAKNKDGYLWGYYVEGSRKTSGAGKATFTGRYKTSTRGSWKTVGSGQVGTLHYFCTDSDTTTGAKFNKVLNKKDGTVTFYISSIMKCNGCTNHFYYSLDSWYRHNRIGWRDRNKDHYRAHYNQKVKFKADTVEVEETACIVKGPMSDSSSLQYQTAQNLSKSSSTARDIKKADYLWSPDKTKQLDAIKLDHHLYDALNEHLPYCKETFRIQSPLSSEFYPKVDIGHGKKQKLMCVGYRVTKTVKDKNGDKSKIILASTMIELHKGSSGDYLPYYIEEKNEDASKADTANGKAISIPKNVKERHVTVKRADRYYHSRNGHASRDNYLMTGDTISVEDWVRIINKLPTFWGTYKALGVRNENGDKTTKLTIDWLYAPCDDVEEASKVTLEQYYTSEDTNISTKEFPSVDDSADLSYKHNSSNKKNELKYTKTLATVNEGDPWVSYDVEQKGESYKLKDGTYSPKSRFEQVDGLTVEMTKKKNTKKFKNTNPTCDFTERDLIEKKDANSGLSNSKIPLVLNKTGKNGNSATCNNYLYKIVIATKHDEVWTEFTAEDIWGNTTPANGKIVKNKSTNRSYTTHAPYMKSYVYVTGSSALNLKARKSDWQKDAYDMTHFIIPEVRGEIKIKAYYASTMPVRTFVYKKTEDGGSYNLVQSETKMSWVSPDVHYRGTYNDGYKVDAIIAATGTHTASKPYTTKQYKKDSFRSVTAAERYYPDHTNLTASTNTFEFDMKEQPVVVLIMVDDSTPMNKYFTQVQYVHTQDGQYHFVKSWKQPIRNLYGPATHTRHLTGYWTDRWGGQHPIYENWECRSTTVKAFVSFPQYVSWDDGNTGLYGSLYEEQGIDYEYTGYKNFPKRTDRRPGRYHTSNNSIIYLTEAGNAAKNDFADKTPGGDNSLVAYCIYEDIFNSWENSQYNPDNKTKNPKTTEEIAIPWNWKLPNGFVWEGKNITSGDTPDETQFGEEYTNPFIAQVLATQGSASYDAQSGIPTTDVIRAQAQVPRYLTKGYWTRHKLAWAYKVYAVYVSQHKSLKKVNAGDNDLDKPACLTGHDCGPSNCSFDYYTSDKVEKEQHTEVRRDSVYYTLGDAEVWDPFKVTMKNDVFSDSAISSNDTITLFGYGKESGYASNARFFKTGDGAYQMPGLKVKRQYVNYGTYNDWESDEDPEDDLDGFTKDAESIISGFKVKNDTVSFYDGLGTSYTLSDGSEGLQNQVQIPSFPPEADLTYPGIFDSYNSVQEGIVVKPEAQNGHHETCPIAYYKQIQCIPTEKYRTHDMIKTKIADDGDDDVLVYTPTVNESKINLDYTNAAVGNDNIRLHPNYDFDQATQHTLDQTISNIQLDREYTMTLSVVGDASDLQGYGWQDYVRYLALDANGVPYTQVKFPFPVQMTIRKLVGGKVITDDRYYYANTWITIEMIDEKGTVTGKINQTFFVPSWATEAEKAKIRFRSIAINAKANNPSFSMENEETNDEFVDSAEQVESRHNAEDERDYVAWMQESDTVTGRISSFQIIDVSDYPAWEPVFRKYDQANKKYTTEWNGTAYHSGICNEFGFIDDWNTMFTTPVVGTSNPASQTVGTLGLGYKIRYKMTTVGPYYHQTDKVSFSPKFYYVNDKGEYLQIDGTYSKNLNTRAEVNVYYSETFNGNRNELVKLGSAQDKQNRKVLNLADDTFSVSQSRINLTNQILNTSNVGQPAEAYNFAKTTLLSNMRTIDGDTHMSAHRGNLLALAADTRYELNSKMYNILKSVEEKPGDYAGTDFAELSKELTSSQVLKSVQTWYGEYYLPSDTYVTTASWGTVRKQLENGYDGSEACWLKGGRLVINFNPEITSETKQALRYDVENVTTLNTGDETVYSAARCNQFKNENCVTSKMLADGSTIMLKSGDVLVYDFYDPNDKSAPPKARSAKDAYDSSGSH